MADLTTKVLGYRRWRYDRDLGTLSGLGYDSWAWGLGENRATCGNGRKHKHVPARDCTCGLHAYFKPQIKPKQHGPFEDPGEMVYGAVAGWGRMEVHSNGFRAQKAEIVALALNENWPQKLQDRVREAARDYGVECVPLSRLDAVALDAASPMPKALIPKKPKVKKRKGDTVHSLTSVLKSNWLSSPALNWTFGLDPATPQKTPEDIGLHSVEAGDVLKYGKEAA